MSIKFNRPGRLGIILAATALLPTTTGCFGTFTMTTAVYDLNHAPNNRFLQTLLFWVITPLYGLAMLADVIVFNTLDFWTGDTVEGTVEYELDDGRVAVLSPVGSDELQLKVLRDGEVVDQQSYLRRDDGKVEVIDSAGQLRATVTPDGDDAFIIEGTDGVPVRMTRQELVEQLGGGI